MEDTTRLISEIIYGFIGGLVAGLVGYAVDWAVGEVFTVFGTTSSMFIVLGIVYAIISFIIGIKDAFVAGTLFSVGIVVAGLLLHDSVTTLSGMISTLGLIAVYIKEYFDDRW